MVFIVAHSESHFGGPEGTEIIVNKKEVARSAGSESSTGDPDKVGRAFPSIL